MTHFSDLVHLNTDRIADPPSPQGLSASWVWSTSSQRTCTFGVGDSSRTGQPLPTRSATEMESAEIPAHAYDVYCPSNITCEIGMYDATGRDFLSIVYLVEKGGQIAKLIEFLTGAGKNAQKYRS